ncbi:MAG: SLBB domain-containing protein [Limnobacter sp.]|nr:SLBB domain-containing protein [Limnobacter sp.]
MSEDHQSSGLGNQPQRQYENRFDPSQNPNQNQGQGQTQFPPFYDNSLNQQAPVNFQNGQDPRTQRAPAEQQRPVPQKRRELSTLQRYLKESTGKEFRYYAEDLFENGAFGSMNNGANAPVPSTYAIGPGDEIMVRMWGGVSMNHTGAVDRDGNFSIPRVGTFPLSGVTLGELNSYLSQQLSKYYTNTNLSASLGQLKGIQIYVVGQAEKPGLYTVSSLSSLVTSVFTVARPGVNGSYRNITLKRGGKQVTKLDLYEFIRSGDTAGDKKLLPGDVIVIEKAGPRVAVMGAVEKPAIYELREGEPLGVAIDLAGVQGSLTAKAEVLIERFETGAARKVIRKTFDQALADTGARDGEVVKLFDVSGNFSNAVTLRGNVADSMRVPYSDNMRVSDLIPDESVLITRDYYKEKDKLINPKLQRDTKDGGKSRGVDIDEVGNSVRNMFSEINWDYAVIERLDPKALKTVLIPFNLRKAIAKDEKENIALQAGDVVTVFSVKDASVPKDNKSITVKVDGEVQAPGFYQVKPGETLQDVLIKAGGITRNAFVFGTKLTRMSIKEQQKEQLKKVVSEAEKMLGAAARNNAVNADIPSDAKAAEEQISRQRAMLEKMRDAEVEGRLVLDIPYDAKALFDIPALALEDGDSITIPFTPSSIAVNGSVFSVGSYVYNPKRSIGYYLDLAGGATKLADTKSIFAVRANGQVISAQQDTWLKFGDLKGKQALPGDLIYVPEDYEYRLSFLKTFGQISKVFYELGLGVAAIDSFRR